MIILYYPLSSEGQYNLTELVDKLQDLAQEGEETYCRRYLPQKLLSHYGDGIIQSKRPGHDTVFTLLDKSTAILRDHHKKSGQSAADIIDLAASLVNDDIRKMVYTLDEYPDLTNLSDTSITNQKLIGLC